MSIRFMLNETSYFGRGAREELAGELKKRNFKKVFLVSDKALVSAGVAAKVEEVLNKIGIPYDLYDEIKPNPTIKNVTDGVEACKASGADVIVTVGGGSSMDTAKAISIVMTNPDRADIKSLNGLSNTKNRAMPVIALPTTAGTASEVTINYVITDEDAEVKMVCVDPNDIPIVAIVLDAIFIIASITDKLDGYLARSRNEITTFGKFLDPIADKILVITAMIILVEMGRLPAWIPTIIVFREFIVSGYRLVAVQNGGKVIAANIWGKLKTVTQMIAIIVAFIDVNSFGAIFTQKLEGYSLVINIITTFIMIICVIATIFSGWEYLKEGKDLFKDM